MLLFLLLFKNYSNGLIDYQNSWRLIGVADNKSVNWCSSIIQCCIEKNNCWLVLHMNVVSYFVKVIHLIRSDFEERMK